MVTPRFRQPSKDYQMEGFTYIHGRQNNGTIKDLLIEAGEIYQLKRIKKG